MDNTEKIDFRIIDAKPEDASFIARGIMDAVGEDICRNMAGDSHTLADVKGVFERLALRDDSQYSWLNSRVAVDGDGRRLGVCVSYDGAGLKRLRRSFFEEANRTFGWGITPDEVEALPGETDGEEFYLDTLMVLPEARGRGIGRRLIKDAAERAGRCGKPLGLLVDPDNSRARRLYDAVGFRPEGTRFFAGVEMDHLQLG
ncbi:MAG: GNAT family N-acetyltransferase [Muribaculaceae bacterium]|nr:GNAT family N-acetyltransferase [Muribaculaceae bacterium]